MRKIYKKWNNNNNNNNNDNNNKLEYLEEYWRPEETCCHSDYSERPPLKTGVKDSLEVK